jgi:hypothetical protein
LQITEALALLDSFKAHLYSLVVSQCLTLAKWLRCDE